MKERETARLSSLKPFSELMNELESLFTATLYAYYGIPQFHIRQIQKCNRLEDRRADTEADRQIYMQKLRQQKKNGRERQIHLWQYRCHFR